MAKELGNHEYVLKLKRNQTREELKFYRVLKRCIDENFPEFVGCIGKQVPVKHSRGFFIIDFYIGKIRLGFEIDGGYHWRGKQLDKDLKRDAILLSEKRIFLHHIPKIVIGLRKNYD